MAPSMSTDDVVSMLAGLDLHACVGSVRDNGVTGDDLSCLTDEELQAELGWTGIQVRKVREALSERKKSSDAEEASEEDVKVDFQSALIPKTSEAAFKPRIFYSKTKPEPMKVSKTALDNFDRLTLRIKTLEKENVETRVSREAERLRAIEQFIDTQKVVYQRLQKDKAKSEDKLEKTQSSWYCGKMFMKCTGKHEQKVENQRDKAEELKAMESSKSEELAKATADHKQSAAQVAELQAQVHELYQCRNAELQLVESLFSSGGVEDDREAQLREDFRQIGPQAHQIREFQRTYAQAEEMLRNAQSQLDQALGALQRAFGAGRMDMAGNFLNPGPDRAIGANLMLELAKKRGVTTAEQMCEHAKQNVIGAKQLIPAMPYVNLGEIKQLNFAMGLIFDNVVSDAIANRKIQANMQAMRDFKGQISQGQSWVNGWLNGRIRQDLHSLEQRERDAKAELDRYRRELLAKELDKL